MWLLLRLWPVLLLLVVALAPWPPLRIQADGEEIGTTPATFDVVPAALDVIVPSDAPPGFLGDAEG